MTTRSLFAAWLALVCHVAVAGEWSLRLGDMDLEGISVDERVAGDTYHLGLASDTVWFTFSFPAARDGRPPRAEAAHVDLNGFEPDIRCTGIGDAGLVLDGFEIVGEVVCSRPGGTLELIGRFEN